MNLHLQKHISSPKLRRLEILALSKIPLLGYWDWMQISAMGKTSLLFLDNGAFCSENGAALHTEWLGASCQFFSSEFARLAEGENIFIHTAG